MIDRQLVDIRDYFKMFMLYYDKYCMGYFTHLIIIISNQNVSSKMSKTDKV